MRVSLLSVILLSGCSWLTSDSRYDQRYDSAPENPFDVSQVPDAVPRYEVRTKAGNKTPYRVLGKTYHLLADSDGYRERGGASWYGEKFHGHKTSNGETYNMYGMTAAHKTLPIPSYVRVTNLDNGRSIVVRVNDRGPFHKGRIIDLSYAGAVKLGYLGKGTANVEVEALPVVTEKPKYTPPEVKAHAIVFESSLQDKPAEQNGDLSSSTYLQVGAFSQQSSAERLRVKVAGLTDIPVNLVTKAALDNLWRVQVGPVNDLPALIDLRSTLEAHRIKFTHLTKD